MYIKYRIFEDITVLLSFRDAPETEFAGYVAGQITVTCILADNEYPDG
jgi:hypothetical protein